MPNTSSSSEHKAYIFTIQLIGGFKPPIRRSVILPASFTFQDLHFVIQYAFGWDSDHVHLFSFYNEKPRKRSGTYIYNPKNEVLQIKAAKNGFNPGFSCVPDDCIVREDKIKLSDVYDDEGIFREVVDMNGKPDCPLVYTYDLGANWDHSITFKGETTTTVDRPVFTEVKGIPPKQDDGDASDWDSEQDDEEEEEPVPPPPRKTQRQLIDEMNDPEKWQEKYDFCRKWGF